jgi:hypothetical protein
MLFMFNPYSIHYANYVSSLPTINFVSAKMIIHIKQPNISLQRKHSFSFFLMSIKEDLVQGSE